MHIAVDYDDTLFCSKTGKPVTVEREVVGLKGIKKDIPLIEIMLSLQANGNKIILYTCREGEKLQEAIERCASHGLTFDAVNDNLPEVIAAHGDSRKIKADCYVDNLAVSPETIVLE